MLTANDRENVTKSVQTTNLLLGDLREVLKTEDPLLYDATMEILEKAVDLEGRLKRIERITREEGKPK